MSVIYEWKAEYEDEWGDVQEVDHEDRLKDLMARTPEGVTIVLIRRTGDEFDGITDIQYAYPEDDLLPSEFDGGSAVPKRFHHEWERRAR